MTQPNLVWPKVQPEEDVVKALHDIRTYGYDIRIVTSLEYPHLLPEKLKWVRLYLPARLLPC